MSMIFAKVLNSVLCHISCNRNQDWATLCAKVPKTLKNSYNRNLARNFKHMNNIFNSNQIQKIDFCAKFLSKQTKFELHYPRKCPKHLKTLKIGTCHVLSSICLWFSIQTILKKIIYTKRCCVPSFVQNKPSLSYFMRESTKKVKKH